MTTPPLQALWAGAYPLVAPPPRAARDLPDEPSFSVVVAAYNCAGTIGEALQSLLSQTLVPTEIIVCDDGSTDATLDVLATFEPRVTVLRRPHAGAAAARNACLAHATSTHIVCFDSDDLLLPTCLEAYRAALMTRPDLQLVTCDAYFETDGTLFDRYYRRAARFEIGDQRRAALHQHFVFGFAAVERKAAVAAGGWDERLVGGWDTDFFLRLILDGATAGLVWEPLAIYRLRAGSLSDDRARSLREMVTIVERAATHPSLNDAEREAVRLDLAAKRRGAAVAELERALLHDPADVRRRAQAIAADAAFSRRTRLLARGLAAFPMAARPARRRLARTVGDGDIRVRGG